MGRRRSVTLSMSMPATAVGADVMARRFENFWCRRERREAESRAAWSAPSGVGGKNIEIVNNDSCMQINDRGVKGPGEESGVEGVEHRGAGVKVGPLSPVDRPRTTHGEDTQRKTCARGTCTEGLGGGVVNGWQNVVRTQPVRDAQAVKIRGQVLFANEERVVRAKFQGGQVIGSGQIDPGWVMQKEVPRSAVKNEPKDSG